jgi:hypothetical protein
MVITPGRGRGACCAPERDRALGPSCSIKARDCEALASRGGCKTLIERADLE